MMVSLVLCQLDQAVHDLHALAVCAARVEQLPRFVDENGGATGWVRRQQRAHNGVELLRAFACLTLQSSTKDSFWYKNYLLNKKICKYISYHTVSLQMINMVTIFNNQYFTHLPISAKYYKSHHSSCTLISNILHIYILTNLTKHSC